jgi:hypothetical protein
MHWMHRTRPHGECRRAGCGNSPRAQSSQQQ